MSTNNEKNYELIIIGSGPAGLTAGIYAARAQLKPLIIEGQKPGGQLMGTTFVENWPGEKKIRGPELMLMIREHAQHTGCLFLAEYVVQTDLQKHPFTLWTRRGKELTTNALIIASGATTKRLNIPGEQEYWGKGISTCAVCDATFYQDKRVIIIGGGDSSMEYALTLSKFTNKITIIQLLDKLTASAAMQERVRALPHINIIFNSTITEIKGNGEHLTHVTILNNKTKESYEQETYGVFLAIGMKPNTNFLQDQLELDSSGYVVCKQHTETSVPGVFAAGDVADARYRQAIASAGTGCMAALDAERYLRTLK